jgi:hypothetical protein
MGLCGPVVVIAAAFRSPQIQATIQMTATDQINTDIARVDPDLSSRIAMNVRHFVPEPGPRMHDLRIQLREFRGPPQQLAGFAGVTTSTGGHRAATGTSRFELTSP